MLKTRIIPCLDVKAGRTVKGIRFGSLRDAGDPVELASEYDAQGADELCFLDITASIEGRGAMLDVVSRTAEQCFMPLTVGGGVRSPADVLALLGAGADKVAVNTAAVEDTEMLCACSDLAGRQCMVMAIDARREGGGWNIYTHGGSRPTGIDAIEFAIRAEACGAGEILLTSMDRDGVGSGYDIELIRAVVEVVGVPVIASGGAGSVTDLAAPVLEGGASAVLAASIFHYGKASIAEAKQALSMAGASIRPI